MRNTLKKSLASSTTILASLFSIAHAKADSLATENWTFAEARRSIVEAPLTLAPPVHIERRSWDKTFKAPDLTPQKLSDVHTLVIHNTETGGRDDDAVRSVLSSHKNRKWSDIGYHFLIAQDSTDKTWKVFEGRRIDRVGAHAGSSYNQNTIGIAVTGAYAWKTASKLKEVRGFFTSARFNTESGQKRYRELLSIYADPSAPESERQLPPEAADVLVRLVDQLVRDPRLSGLKRIRSHGALSLKELNPKLTDSEAKAFAINPYHTDCSGHGMIHIVKALQDRYQPMLADRTLLTRRQEVPAPSVPEAAPVVSEPKAAPVATQPESPPMPATETTSVAAATPESAPVATRAWIADQASQSSCSTATWSQRGKAPVGYVPGMALTYARSLCRLKGLAPLKGAAEVMARGKGKSSSSDALNWYESRFDTEKLEIDAEGPETLKSLYTLMIGLGMRETSGKYCTGYDTTARGLKSSTAEAGLFQTSYNSLYFTSTHMGFSEHHLQKLYDEYRANPERCYLPVFKQGVSCKSQKIIGSGAGATFQKFSKECPAFAAESAGVMLRLARKHYGPINRREAQLNTSCTDLLDSIEKQIEADPEAACSELR